MKNKILILGAGFGGIRVALDLTRYIQEIDGEIILINKNNYQDFYIDLYEIATAFIKEQSKKRQIKLDFSNLKMAGAIPLKEIFKNKKVKIIVSEVRDVSIKDKLVYLSSGQKIKFDFLVLALGSQTNYFNIPNLENKSLGLKSVNDAINIRNAIDELFYRKNKDEEIRIVIGGGGFTGCELAGELVCYLKKLSRLHNHNQDRVVLAIVEACPELLSGAGLAIRKAAKKRLEKLGIKFFFNSKIVNVLEKELVLADNSKIPFDLLLWTAGIKPNDIILKSSEINKAKNNCAVVNKFLQVESYKNIFAIGDNAYCFDEKNQCPVSATAQAAIAQGKIVAKNIRNLILNKELIEYKPRLPKFLIPLGGKYALADFRLFILKGFLPWLLKRIVVLKYYLSILSVYKAIKFWLKGFKIYLKND